MDTTEAQRIVSDATKARGYWDGLAPEQIAARQVAKLAEELDEYSQYIAMPWEFESRLISLGGEARRIFDDPKRWYDCEFADEYYFPAGTTAAELAMRRRAELADLMVVLLNMAQAEQEATGVPFDIIQAACEKATADIERGVRSGS